MRKGAPVGADTLPEVVYGRTEPRIFTEPLRPLTRETSWGYAVCDFADQVLGRPLLPWQRWVVIHALELEAPYTTRDEGWRFRFRIVLVLVARQNGKSDLSRVIALWKLFILRMALVCGTAQDLDVARKMLDLTNELVEETPALLDERTAYIRANGKERLKLTGGREYVIKATNRKAGRSLTVDHLTLDELREQTDWLAWGALTKTTNAVRNGQTWAMSNAGDDASVVLNSLQENAVTGRNPRLFLAEYSGPEGCELDDVEALAQANPALGYLIDLETLLSDVRTDPPNVVRTEILCQRVDQLDGAVDLTAWKSCADPSGSMADLRDRVVVCLDVSPDGGHVSLVASASTPDGRVRVEPVAAWSSTQACRAELPGWLDRIAPVALAWFPGGPAAALAADLRELPGSVEIKGSEVSETCQEFADLVRAGRVIHSSDPLLDAHVAGAAKMRTGDGWRFARRGAGHVDALYAAAGAAHTVRTLPVEKPRRRAFAV